MSHEKETTTLTEFLDLILISSFSEWNCSYGWPLPFELKWWKYHQILCEMSMGRLLMKRQEEVDPKRKHRSKPHDSSRSLINEKIHPIIDFQEVSICKGYTNQLYTCLKLLRPEDDDVWSFESLLKWCPPCILGGCKCSSMLSRAWCPIFF